MNIFVLTCVLIFMVLGSASAAQRALEENKVEILSTFSILNLVEDCQSEIFQQVSLRLQQQGMPTVDLRLVCTQFYSFSELRKGKRWSFTNKNFPSFKKEIEQPWVELKLSELAALSFKNHVDPSALDDELSAEEWNDKYVFTYENFEDFEYIAHYATRLRKLNFYNIPSLITHLNTPLPCATSLRALSFDYDTEIFDASILSDDLNGCSQFINLERMCLHSGVFTAAAAAEAAADAEAEAAENKVAAFFAPFTNLRTLELLEMECDRENKKYATDLFWGLTGLTKLNTLDISFVVEPDFLAITNLSSLKFLKDLSIEFYMELNADGKPSNDERSVDDLDILPMLFDSLSHLENITIVDRQKKDELKSFSISNSLRKKHPQLMSIKSNMGLAL